MKEVNSQNSWNFELGSQQSMDVHIRFTAGFQLKDRQVSQSLINDTFYRLPVTSCQCTIGTGKYPEAGILLNIDDDDNSQGYRQIEEALRALTKINILQPYISDDDIRSSYARADDAGCNL